MADQTTILEKVNEILKPYYDQIADQDVRLPALCACQSDKERVALAEGLRGLANTWATQALLAVVKHPDMVSIEPGRLDDFANRLVSRLAEDAAEFYSTEGYANFPNYRSQIREALLKDLPKIAEHLRDVNRRRYLGDQAGDTSPKAREASGGNRTDRRAVIGPGRNKPSARRGYRREVRQWMKSNGLETIPDAARRLGVGPDTRDSKGKGDS